MDEKPLETKKITFGFSKVSKKPNILNLTKKTSDIQLIESIENSKILVKDPVEIEKKPLVISIKGNANNLLGRIEEAAKRNKTKNQIIEPVDDRPDSDLTADELAARELLKEAKARLENGTSHTTKIYSLPLEEELTIDGAEEPSMDDYENVPISDYGLAMLRGMGWKEGITIGKNPGKNTPFTEPELRPKGLGLGANKMVENKKEAVDKQGKPLILIKGAYVKIIAGSTKGTYCEVQGFDEDAGRIILKTPKGEIISLNESFAVPISKEEYSLGVRVINNAKYEQYKESENSQRNTNFEATKIKIEESDRSSRKIKSEIDTDDDKRQPSSSKTYSRVKEESEKSDRHGRREMKKSHKSDRRHRSLSRSPSRKKSHSRYRSSSSSDSDYKKSTKKSSRKNHSDSDEYEQKYSSRNSKNKKHKKEKRRRRRSSS